MFLKRGEKCFSEGRYDEALSEYEYAVAVFGGKDSVKTLVDFYNWCEYIKGALPPASKWRAAAMATLGKRYFNGDGVEQDKKKAVELYKRAAELGNVRAMCNLGECYERGEGVPKNMSEAFRLYRQAADLGNAFAMSNLGVCYDRGIEGVLPQDKKKSS